MSIRGWTGWLLGNAVILAAALLASPLLRTWVLGWLGGDIDSFFVGWMTDIRLCVTLIALGLTLLLWLFLWLIAIGAWRALALALALVVLVCINP